MLLFFKPLSAFFLLICFLAGFSDILDGFIARKMNFTSKLGAALDSIADAIFIFVLLGIFLSYFHWPGWSVLWVTVIAIIRFASLLIGFIKYRTFAFLHTYANKSNGLALFCFPFLYHICGLNVTAFLLCCFSTISALEELFINAASKILNRDVASIFTSSTKQ